MVNDDDVWSISALRNGKVLVLATFNVVFDSSPRSLVHRGKRQF